MVTEVLPVCCPHLDPGVVGPEQLGYPGGRGGGAGPRAGPPVGVVQPGQRSGDRLLLLQPSGAMTLIIRPPFRRSRIFAAAKCKTDINIFIEYSPEVSNGNL